MAGRGKDSSNPFSPKRDTRGQEMKKKGKKKEPEIVFREGK
jgi:hypothetical protein